MLGSDLQSEMSDIYRDISAAINIEAFWPYRWFVVGLLSFVCLLFCGGVGLLFEKNCHFVVVYCW